MIRRESLGKGLFSFSVSVDRDILICDRVYVCCFRVVCVV